MNKTKNFFYKLILIFFLFCIFIFSLAKSYSHTMFNNISDNFVRLHIIANSDSTSDQILKYKIRDKVIEYMTPFFSGITTKNEALEVLKAHTNDIINISYNIANSNGYFYPIHVSVGNYYFSTREYDTITLPEGYYDSLKIEIGDAKGQNWWCVMFPSLCLIDSGNQDFQYKSSELLQENLSTEEYSIISNDAKTIDLKIKFKLIELFENI